MESTSEKEPHAAPPEPSRLDVTIPATAHPAPRAARSKGWLRRHWHFLALILLALAAVLARPIARHARAAELLVSFVDPTAKPAVTEELVDIDVPASSSGPARTVKARIYAPPGTRLEGAPSVVLVHGVQYLGIEEPRLQRFARAIVSSGIVVMTPQVDELADYHVAPRSIDTVGAAVRALRSRTGLAQVGLLGTSFGGGVALLTAVDPRFADAVAFVVAIGAHDDLARVSRFFVTDTATDVSGLERPMHAHEYGATVLVYSHIEDFFPTEDVPAAREALRLWLWEKQAQARDAAKALSPVSRAKIQSLFDADFAGLRPELLAEIDRRAEDMKAVSPHGRLAGLRAHTYLLHGEGDTVIPATETAWLGRDVPKAALRDMLVSPAIVHVELKEPTTLDRWKLVHFLAQVVDEAEATR